MTTGQRVPDDLERWLAANEERSLAELVAFLRIPSISARAEHASDVRRAAEWLDSSLRRLGFLTEVVPTAGHPLVIAELRKAPAGAPTVLIYGHYDVQPPEPLDRWTSPPFEPTIRDGKLFARGAVDDKGQLWVHVCALEAHLATRGALPVNVIVLAEGEEEVGSRQVIRFIEENAARLRADAIVVSDTPMFAPGVPSIMASLRGIAYFQIDVDGATGDLHSGQYGGAVVNPATVLTRIVSSMHDRDGRVAIPGFYDAVRPVSEEWRAAIRTLPFDTEAFKADAGGATLFGEAGYTTLERVWTRPTCEVNGLVSGYGGEGAKTIIPANAMAKISFRLVPDQEPEEVDRLLHLHVERCAPPEARVRVRLLHGGRPWRTSTDGPLFTAAHRALAAAFGREPVVAATGGAIPIVPHLERIVGAPVLLMGFGLPGENAHAPDEWISLDNFRRGQRASATLLELLGSHQVSPAHLPDMLSTPL
jgi:acetylornithine deacetylase/succinyl-diaminopimelate desuccinylase-like protein